MYYYLYDEAVTSKRNQSELYRIEARLADLGIQGKIGRLTALKSADDMIGAAIRAGAKTIVAVGTDEIVTKAIRAIINAPVTFGIIPLGDPTTMATQLGIPKGVAACDVLSARMLINVDVGRINQQYFLSSLHIPTGHVVMRCDNAYSLRPSDPQQSIDIFNFDRGDPTDGRLNAVISPRSSRMSFSRESASMFLIKRARIEHVGEPVEIIADGHAQHQTPAVVDIAPKHLTIIVGRKRTHV